MLEKRDVLYYKRLAYTQAILGVAIFGLCFVTGVAAKYNFSEVHLFAPYWVGIPLILQGLVTFQAARSHKRWPLGIWFPLFFIFLAAACSFMIVMPPYKAEIYYRFPCFVQQNYKASETRCICAHNRNRYLVVNGASSITPCVRALDIMQIMANVCYMLIVVALIPQLMMFVLVCNDLCCISCRRAALVPQVIVTGGMQQPGSVIPVHSETVTYRTDEQPGSSTGAHRSPQTGGYASSDQQAPPLPHKVAPPGQLAPCSF